MDDARGRTCADWTARDRVIASVARWEVEALDEPHIVHVVDPYLDVPLAFGPFAGPELASRFADRYESDVRYEGCEEPVRVTIVPLRSV